MCILSETLSEKDICSICRCMERNKSVDCSDRNLTKIPFIPETIAKTLKKFIFNGNNLGAFSVRVLQNVPENVTDLIFQNCGIKTITDEKIFQKFSKLNKLSLGENQLDKESIENLFRNFHFSTLNVSDNNFGQYESTLNMSVSNKMRFLMLNNCNITNIEPFIKTKTNMKLFQIEFERNLITGDSLKSFIRYGKYYNSSLGLIKLSSNPITKLELNTFSTLNYLHTLMLSDLGVKFKPFSFRGINSSSLTFLDFSGSLTIEPTLDFGQMFKLSPGLKDLSLSRSDFSTVTDANLYDMLSPLTSLSALDLSNSSGSFVPCAALRSLRKLRALDLSDNRITSWQDSCFKNMSSNLIKLYLYRNNITMINETSFPLKFLGQLDTLYLYGNPFRCVCLLHWFRDWMREANNYEKLDVLNSYRNGSYNCYSPPELKNTLLVNFDPNYEMCGFPTILVVAGLLISLLFLATITLIVMKKFYLYKTRKGYDKLSYSKT